MSQKPILFSGPMVRAILEGRKTQTRRIGKCQNADATELGVEYSKHATKGDVAVATYRAFPNGGSARCGLCECPYGIPGDQLWVRETFALWPGGEHHKAGGEGVTYRADCIMDADAERCRADLGVKWKPSIHMPRKLSRITLEIVKVRVERLQDISEAEGEAEGVDFMRHIPDADETLTAKTLYKILWDSINKKKAPWSRNPWVWAVEFRRLQ